MPTRSSGLVTVAFSCLPVSFLDQPSYRGGKRYWTLGDHVTDTIRVSSGPVAGSYFALSPFNHYLESYSQPGTTQPPFGQWEYHGGGFFLTDFAFDSSNGKLFSLTDSSASGGPEGLVQLTNTGPYAGVPHGELL